MQFRPTPLMARALRAEVESQYDSSEFRALCARLGASPERVRQRALAELDELLGNSGAEVHPSPVAATVRPRARNSPYGRQQQVLCAIYSLSLSGKRRVTTTEINDAMEAAGFGIKKPSDVRSNYLIAYVNDLANKGLVDRESEGRRVYVELTDRGIAEVAELRPLLGRFLSARQAALIGEGRRIEEYGSA